MPELHFEQSFTAYAATVVQSYTSIDETDGRVVVWLKHAGATSLNLCLVPLGVLEVALAISLLASTVVVVLASQLISPDAGRFLFAAAFAVYVGIAIRATTVVATRVVTHFLAEKTALRTEASLSSYISSFYGWMYRSDDLFDDDYVPMTSVEDIRDWYSIWGGEPAYVPPATVRPVVHPVAEQGNPPPLLTLSGMYFASAAIFCALAAGNHLNNGALETTAFHTMGAVGTTLLGLFARYIERATTETIDSLRHRVTVPEVFGRIVYDTDDDTHSSRTNRSPAPAAPQPPLLRAAFDRNASGINACSSDVNQSDEQGNTPLHWLFKNPIETERDQNQTLEALRALLSKGADVSIQNRAGQRPLELGATEQRGYPRALPVLQELLDRGGDRYIEGTNRKSLATAAPAEDFTCGIMQIPIEGFPVLDPTDGRTLYDSAHILRALTTRYRSPVNQQSWPQEWSREAHRSLPLFLRVPHIHEKLTPNATTRQQQERTFADRCRSFRRQSYR